MKTNDHCCPQCGGESETKHHCKKCKHVFGPVSDISEEEPEMESVPFEKFWEPQRFDHHFESQHPRDDDGTFTELTGTLKRHGEANRKAGSEPKNKMSESLRHTASWVIKSIDTGEIVFETFNPSVVSKLNKSKYIAVPIDEHLKSLNDKSKQASRISWQDWQSKVHNDPLIQRHSRDDFALTTASESVRLEDWQNQ